jgi:hypothetical protein
VFNFEPTTKADAGTLLEFIADNPEAFRTWLSIADDDDRATFFGRISVALLGMSNPN